ncbi:NUDIX hydrolase [Umezakia ovalisporum]|jgi:8-oxo-dGTP pyrophosphatase MutT (NUDIX family)|uniref:NUDIX hydrolase n=2 Tax=Umezakia ovalisporum TaxID=75695 RepID=A0AA43KE37_9CYAN|nr:NUDIX hydrolase [Umezakia ovalisporum]MBI1241056.1 NUDIX domain-containing protein [Nostoc sp. RI_552]MDH6055830.1 NUDIX hydrolase [Umezakia ovalisporum FSS-43]MDH6063176.1 NUDIX hydrolase [Umezakia ovalisporum FSS-62]MDH6068936.1 NUDIX hydrolase [Umezakia ovalisporum APH033B]MDH6070638.1 NUDIX hydrolase [Umezakia ovalisporum CobakiLakeA]
MSKQEQIRVLALGLIRDGHRIFVSQGYDPLKQETYYRALGGGVDFGETSQGALQREFQEEIQAELTNIHYVGCIESIFTFNGRQGHEIIQVYQCDFTDTKFYQLESLIFSEPENCQHQALWVDIAHFKSGKLKLVPEAFFAYL